MVIKERVFPSNQRKKKESSEKKKRQCEGDSYAKYSNIVSRKMGIGRKKGKDKMPKI